MAIMEFDLNGLAQRLLTSVLDETIYKGQTLREWIEEIAAGEYELKKVDDWIYFKDSAKCPKCDVKISINSMIKMNDGVWNYCPICGMKLNARNFVKEFNESESTGNDWYVYVDDEDDEDV